VQDFIALVDSRSSLLLARKARGIVEVADDPPILEMQLRREIKLNRHAAETPRCAGGSPGKLPAFGEYSSQIVRSASRNHRWAYLPMRSDNRSRYHASSGPQRQLMDISQKRNAA
jgi:hypothetical protein